MPWRTKILSTLTRWPPLCLTCHDDASRTRASPPVRPEADGELGVDDVRRRRSFDALAFRRGEGFGAISTRRLTTLAPEFGPVLDDIAEAPQFSREAVDARWAT